MAKKKCRFMPHLVRSRFLNPYSGGKILARPSTRSSVRASTVGPVSRSYADDYLYVPRTTYHHHPYDTTGNEYSTHSEINRELILSTAAMDDNYDITARSRARDRDVIAAANRAVTPSGIVSAHVPYSRDTSQGASRRSALRTSRKAPRSQSVPAPLTSPSTTSANLIPYGLTASPPPKPSPYLNYAKSLQTNRELRNHTYEPLYSSRVRTTILPLRALSPYRSESPYRSDSPIESDSVYRSSPSRFESKSRLSKRRKPPRVLASKKRVGNYYNRLLSKRASSGKEGKYWPYIDVEDIDTESIGDLVDDDGNTGQVSEYNYASPVHTPYSYVIEGEDGRTRTYTYEPLPLSDYDIDIPDEYVPFKPKPREVSPETDYSQMSVVPYLPKRDPAKNTSQDFINFNAVVTQSALRARKALENVNWDKYDSAGLVLSVEGEYIPPEQNAALGFRYVSRPIMLKVPAAQRVRASDSDNAFTKYMTDLRKFRDEVRNRLEEGYSTLNRHSAVKYEVPQMSSSYTPSYTSTYRRPYLSSSRQVDATKDVSPFEHRLELYPLSSTRSSSHSRTRDADTSVLKLYDAKHDKDSKLGTLARVEIKAALLASKVESLMPERKRRPKSVYAQARLRALERERRGSGEKEVVAGFIEDTSNLHAHRPVRGSTYYKAHWDADGNVKKPNIMSMERRLDALISPDDLLILPRSLGGVKAQLRDVKDRMDRHRQLMDRYLVTDKGLSSDDMKAIATSKAYLGRRI
ncbi:uncharacterized protein LOC127844621 isoform X3 [Dreissena polymorpha]|uniref:uncharacterized protein LOC127844621 isoform X3 n=1 Tax=Dreissena polymorpha TaxID=45954 RepID=UPI0022647885|nr:uncharacterized protein LOC127844621 isoform X3 [Dreissena polymorpha]